KKDKRPAQEVGPHGPSPTFTPLFAVHSATVRARHSHALLWISQHWMSGTGSAPHVSGAQMPAPRFVPPVAAHALAVKASHSLSSPVALGTQHITSGWGGGTSAQGSGSQVVPTGLTVPPAATQTVGLRSSHSISSPAALGRQQTPCSAGGGRSPQGFV